MEVPALPPLPDDNRSRSVWLPLLVAAAVLLVVLGAVAAVTALGGERELQPAPSPSPTVATEATARRGRVHRATERSRTSFRDRLYVGGEQVPGDWSWAARAPGPHWIGGRLDGTSWWGYDAEPQRLDGFMQPTAAPLARAVATWARILDEGADGLLTGADTESGGEGFGGVPDRRPSPRDGCRSASRGDRRRHW